MVLRFDTELVYPEPAAEIFNKGRKPWKLAGTLSNTSVASFSSRSLTRECPKRRPVGQSLHLAAKPGVYAGFCREQSNGLPRSKNCN